jgi:hypothetical protein
VLVQVVKLVGSFVESHNTGLELGFAFPFLIGFVDGVQIGSIALFAGIVQVGPDVVEDLLEPMGPVHY